MTELRPSPGEGKGREKRAPGATCGEGGGGVSRLGVIRARAGIAPARAVRRGGGHGAPGPRGVTPLGG